MLRYATAQPFAKIEDGKLAYYFFTPSAGIAPQFVFAARTIKSVDSKAGVVSRHEDRVYVDRLSPSTSVAIGVQTRAGKTVHIVLLSQEQAEHSWKVLINQQEHMFITPADVFVDGENVHLRSRDVNALSFSVFPEAVEHLACTVPLQRSGKDGVFVSYTASVEARQVAVSVEKARDATPASPVKMGKSLESRPAPVATAPDDADFNKAGVWRLTLPKGVLEGLSDIFLEIHYAGDVARLYEGTRLLDDNFFNGTTWEVGLKRFAPEVSAEGVELKVLPLRKDAPIYLPKAAWLEFKGRAEIAEVKTVTVSPEYEVRLTIGREIPSH